jgi:hypothetical protein
MIGGAMTAKKFVICVEEHLPERNLLSALN